MGGQCSSETASKPLEQIKIHGMPVSQNACGAMLLAKHLGVGDFELCNLMDGSHKKPDYLKIHPYGQIPALQEGEFTLGESSAILRYLALAYGQKCYPVSNPKKCAKIDFAMDSWSVVYKEHVKIVYVVFGFGTAVDDQAAANKAYTEAIDQWFQIHVKTNKFVAGDEPTIADFKVAPFLYAAIQPCMKSKVGFEPPPRAVQYCNDFKTAVSASAFMDSAGGYSIKEYAETKK